MSNKAIDITASDFRKDVIDSELPVLVDFWAPWCTPCLMMAPVLDEIAGDPELGTKVKIRKVNTEVPLNSLLTMQMGIQSIPNMKLFHKGKIVKEFIGMRPAEVFREELKEALKLK